MGDYLSARAECTPLDQGQYLVRVLVYGFEECENPEELRKEWEENGVLMCVSTSHRTEFLDSSKFSYLDDNTVKNDIKFSDNEKENPCDPKAKMAILFHEVVMQRASLTDLLAE